MRATERITGEVIDRPGKDEDLGIIEMKEIRLKRIVETIRMVKAETARLNSENARIAEEKLTEDRLKAEECERVEYETLKRKIEKTSRAQTMDGRRRNDHVPSSYPSPGRSVFFQTEGGRKKTVPHLHEQDLGRTIRGTGERRAHRDTDFGFLFSGSRPPVVYLC